MARTTSLYRSRLLVEQLEGRALPAQVDWINSAGGDWAMPENWSTGRLPGADDDVRIDLSAEVSVIHSAGTSVIRSLANHETLVLIGGTLSIAAASTSDGEIDLAGGTLTGTGTLTVNGRFVWIEGAMNGADAVTVTNGVLLIVGAAPKTLGRTLENNGWAYVTGEVRMNSAGFHNGPDGTLDLDNVRFVNQGFSGFGTSGLMRARNGVAIALPYVGLNGTVEVYDSGLGMGAGVGGRVSWAGTIQLFGGAGVGASTDIFESNATITGEGNVSAGSDRVTLGGDLIQITGNVSLGGMSGNVTAQAFAIGGRLTINATYGSISSPDFRSGAVAIQSSSGATVHDAHIITGEFLLSGGGRSEILDSEIVAETFSNTSLIVSNSHVTADVITNGIRLVARGATTFTAHDRFVNNGDLVGPVVIEGNMVNAGSLSMDWDVSGVIAVTGNFTQTASGWIAVRLAGTEPGTGYDQIQIGGTATLDGRLYVELRNGFIPSEGDSFDVLTFAERVGNFATISVPQFDDEVFLDPAYGDVALMLVATRR